MTAERNNILTTLRLQSSLDDVTSPSFWKALVAESFGTFILVFLGLGSCYGDAKLVGVAIAFGFAGSLGIWATAPISGGNINPAVSLGLLVARKMSLIRCIMYMVFQFLGAVAAAKLILIMTDGAYKVNGLSIPTVSADKALYCEIVTTFVLVFIVMRMCVEKARTEAERGVAALAIGISIMVGVLSGANIGGASMNPARTIGPAIASAYYDNLWIYIAGPLIGGALAGFLQQLVFTSELSKRHVISYLTSATFDCKERQLERDDDLESNGSTEKTSLKKGHKFCTKKNSEKHELLDKNEAMELTN